MRTVFYLAPVVLVFIFVPRGRPSDAIEEEVAKEVELTPVADAAAV